MNERRKGEKREKGRQKMADEDSNSNSAILLVVCT
jgi:hypothetical protein